METCIIKVEQEINSPSALTREQGLLVFNKIINSLENNEKAIVDFDGIESLITPFLNVAIGKLYETYTSEKLSGRIEFVNIPEGKTSSFNLVIQNAKMYYQNKKQFGNTVEGVLQSEQN